MSEENQCRTPQSLTQSSSVFPDLALKFVMLKKIISHLLISHFILR